MLGLLGWRVVLSCQVGLRPNALFSTYDINPCCESLPSLENRADSKHHVSENLCSWGSSTSLHILPSVEKGNPQTILQNVQSKRKWLLELGQESLIPTIQTRIHRQSPVGVTPTVCGKPLNTIHQFHTLQIQTLQATSPLLLSGWVGEWVETPPPSTPRSGPPGDSPGALQSTWSTRGAPVRCQIAGFRGKTQEQTKQT